MEYKKLRHDGNIGLISNSAGECMAMMDLLEAMGGKPANFLDLGGRVIHEQIREMLNLMEFDSGIKTIFINNFGGMSSCIKMASVIKK